ncbi:hypothetical protein [Streptomyces mirabilis]|uniref:hypothetical protein n=1 Tax=Streptomyces mirabilis TaxID=68239 RepID=UPI0036CDDA55
MEEGSSYQDHSRLLAEALGRVVQGAAAVETQLRTLAAALIGSKYAAIVVAGQSTSNLVQMIDAISRVHDQLSPERRDELGQLLARVKAANKQRNDFAHGMWAVGADGAVMAHNSRYRQFDWSKSPVSHSALTELSKELGDCTAGLLAWTFATLPDAIQHEAQLRWEAYVKSLTPEEVAALAQRRARVSE